MNTDGHSQKIRVRLELTYKQLKTHQPGARNQLSKENK